MTFFDESYNERMKSDFSRISNKLLSNTFICRDRKQDKEDYYFILRKRHDIEKYFDVIDWKLDVDEVYGVVQLTNSRDFNRYQLKKIESILLAVFRIIYHKLSQEISLGGDISVSIEDVHNEIKSFWTDGKMMDKTKFEDGLRTLKRFRIIEDVKISGSERVLIYPSILKALPATDIREVSKLIDAYIGKWSEENEDS